MKRMSTDMTGFKAYRALLSLAFEHQVYFALAVIGMIVFAASDAVFAYLMKPMLDDGFILREPDAVTLIPLAIVAIFMVRVVAVFLRTYYMDLIARSVINQLRQQMFEKLLILKSSEYDQASSSAMVTRFSFDVEQVASSVSYSLAALIQDSLRFFFLFSYMFWVSWQLTLIFLTIGPIVFIIVVKVSARFRRISKRIQTSMGDVTQVVQEVIDANRIVKIFGGGTFERKKFAEANRQNLKLHLKISIAQAISNPLIQLIVAIAFAIIVAVATSESLRDLVTTGDFVSYIFALTMLFAPLRSLSSVNVNIQKGIAAGESIYQFLDGEDEKDRGRLPAKPIAGELTFRDVTLRYQRGDQPVLDQLSFTIKPRQTVAIVGRSGSGKSSLVHLIPRLYEHDHGDILLDHQPIQDYPLQYLREQIAYVGQDARLFNDTVRNNIAYGMLHRVDDAQIIAAAEQAYAWIFIKDLEDGLDTMVGENGVLLSGGQRQRIAVARALLKDAPILILDEATSALDTQSERFIQHAIENLLTHRTTLVIAHRLSTIENADHILVLDQGLLVEQGSHASLLEAGGIYAKLHAMQFQDQGAVSSSLTVTPKQDTVYHLKKSEFSYWLDSSTAKRQGWWLWSMNPVSMLLIPLSLLFYILANIRRQAYRRGLLKSIKLPVTTIVIGNITLGGNGKTPMVIALYQLLKSRGYEPAIITRGYKSGKENCLQLLSAGQVDPHVGDEANMMSEICRCPIGVGANRVAVAQRLLAEHPQVNLILSDDGLQHYALQRDLEIAICRYVAFGNGLLLPAGPLRESRQRLQDCDLVINRNSEQVIESFSTVWNLFDPKQQRSISDFQGLLVHALAGIGFPEAFFSNLKQMGIDLIEHQFPNHHPFSARDLLFTPTLPILVTHKDAIKLRTLSLHADIWVVPLQVELAPDLQNQLLHKLESQDG